MVMAQKKFKQWVDNESKYLTDSYGDLQLLEGEAEKTAVDYKKITDHIRIMKKLILETEHMMKRLSGYYVELEGNRRSAHLDERVALKTSEMIRKVEDIKDDVEMLRKERAYMMSVVNKMRERVNKIRQVVREMSRNGSKVEKYCDRIEAMAMHLHYQASPKGVDVSSAKMRQADTARGAQTKWVNQ